MATRAYNSFLKYLVHKLLAIITKFFVNFIKTSLLLKIHVIKKPAC